MIEHKLSAMFLSAFCCKTRCEYRDHVTVFTFVLERCATVVKKNDFDKTPEKNSNNKRDENATVKKIMVVRRGKIVK